jgi:hypothetical protein
VSVRHVGRAGADLGRDDIATCQALTRVQALAIMRCAIKRGAPTSTIPKQILSTAGSRLRRTRWLRIGEAVVEGVLGGMSSSVALLLSVTRFGSSMIAGEGCHDESEGSPRERHHVTPPSLIVESSVILRAV